MSEADTVDTKITNPRGAKKVVVNIDGKEINRVDLIRQQFAEGKTRGEIRKFLMEHTGESITYQTIYAATKPEKEGAPELKLGEETTEDAEV